MKIFIKIISRICILTSMFFILVFIISLSVEFAKELDFSNEFIIALWVSYIIIYMFIQDLVIQKFIKEGKVNERT